MQQIRKWTRHWKYAGYLTALETPSASDRIHIDKADMKLLEDYHGMQDSQRKRLLAYVQTLKKLESLENLN